MSLRKYGIYLAYGAAADLKTEGLGRHLAAFLRAAASRPDVRFVVACPSWSRKNLLELCEAEGVSVDGFDLITPAGTPAVLRLSEVFQKKSKGAPKPNPVKQLLIAVHTALGVVWHSAEKRVASSRHVWVLILLWLAISALAALSAVPAILFVGVAQLFRVTSKPVAFILGKLRTQSARLRARLLNVGGGPLFSRLNLFMEERELELINSMIRSRTDIKAWYSPTAFWPSFNKIDAPKLMCVPDVVVAQFPIGFSDVGGDEGLKRLKSIQKAIYTGENFVTYSSHVKWNTLVKNYAVDPKVVTSIPHAINSLAHLVEIKGFSDPEAASDYYCRWRFKIALSKASIGNYIPGFENYSAKFLIYPSQFRPSKNIISLLKAYEYLLRTKYIPHKLILTGAPHEFPAAADFVQKYNLSKDVLFLHGLSLPELAACYKLADLAINPSMAEGGCPFTLTEALSVNTPVVMARIPVTTEVITDPALQDMMLFNPLDWKDLAHKIEWAIENKEHLLSNQKVLYAQLSTRTWETVVNDYIDILDRISRPVEEIDHNRDYAV